MDKIWLNQYADGVPADIHPDSSGSVVTLFEQAVRKFSNLPAFSNLGTTLTFSRLDTLSTAFAAYLQKHLGINKGDCIAIMLPNVLQFPIALFGAIRAGAMVTNINPLYTARELEQQLNDSSAKSIVIISDATHVLAEVLVNTKIESVIVTWLDDMGTTNQPYSQTMDALEDCIEFNSVLATGARLAFDPVDVHGDDILFLQYTGGTTGISKGAMLTHRNLVANLLQFLAMGGPKFESGNEIVITVLPLYHIFALTINCLAFVCMGCLNVLITHSRDLPGLVAELANWKFTCMTGVNTLFSALLNTEGFTDLDFSGVKVCMGGGAALHGSVMDRWIQVTGCRLSEGYGLTETSPLVTVNFADSTEFDGSIGIPIPSTEISLRDPEGKEVSRGEAGELCVKGPQVMHGYWRQQDATREVMTEDGFLKTGDIATMDEKGYFYIVDRKKDIILVSGFNVFPNQVEEVIAQCEGVLENACVGVLDEKSGEAVKAFVVAKPDARLTVDNIRKHCKQYLTAYKIPKHVEFIDALPKSTVGKILRRELRASL